MKDSNFVLLGASGYIAKKHIKAIRENKCNLVAYTDPHDNVGFIDSYFPQANYYKEIERLDRNISRLKSQNINIDYFSICTPNYLHDSHVRFALKNNCNAICEKPLVIKYEHLLHLEQLKKEFDKEIYVILQLRHLPQVKKMKKDYENLNKKVDVDLKYITPRGKWYEYSWKGDFNKSGGILFNIGIHFFDMLIYIFGDYIDYEINIENKKVNGLLNLEKANVKFELSIDPLDLPNKIWKPYRKIKIDNKEFDISPGFTDLHSEVYRSIIDGKGETINDIKRVTYLIDKMVYDNESN